MKLLAIDTSSRSASCAVTEDGRLLAEFYTDVGLTHSRTILPMVQSLLSCTGLALREMDCFGVTHGPGSFTGLRIGIAAVKGFAHALGKPCIGVSTLESLAWNLSCVTEDIVPVLDARCGQVYTALFTWEGDAPVRVWEDQAISIAELENRLKIRQRSVFLVGDGAELCYNKLEGCVPCRIAPTDRRLTRAAGAAFACERGIKEHGMETVEALGPVYLRLPQAERELLAKKKLEQ